MSVDNIDDSNIVHTDEDTEENTWRGHCPQCKKATRYPAWCNSCDRKALVDKFNTWSTGNEALDLFIQETQRTAEGYNKMDSYLEYVPYDRLTDVKPLARGGFAELFTATWLDGRRVWKKAKGNDTEVDSKGRSYPFMTVLKVINNSAKMDKSFVDELKLHYQLDQKGGFSICYGITRDPETMNYALILQYFLNGDLRKTLTNDPNSRLTWENRLHQLWRVSSKLKGIHEGGHVHRDIHGGNVLLGKNNLAHLTDFGLTQPVDSPHSTKEGTYGVIPYMAPELFRGEPHSKASDVYAVGIIMSEIASHEPAFCDRDHDTRLQLEIIDGLRPDVPPETPECYKKLMDRCLSGDPQDRPTVDELTDLFWKWYNDCEGNKGTAEAKQFKMADRLWGPKRPKKRHPGAVYTSRLIAHVKKDD